MKYLLVGLNGLTAKLTYRSNEISKLVLKLLQMMISIWMWRYLYRGSSSINGFTLSTMETYLIITNIMSIVFTTAPTFRLAGMIKNGVLNTILYRPISVFGEGLATFIGGQFIYIGMGAILVASIMTIQTDFLSAIILLFYFVLCLLMFYTLTFFLGTVGFWVVNMWPLRSAVNAVYLLLGGLYFPLSFLTKHNLRWLELNPFSLVTDVPARIITGQATQPFIVYLLAVMGWIVIFYLLYRWSWQRGIRKYEGVGV